MSQTLKQLEVQQTPDGFPLPSGRVVSVEFVTRDVPNPDAPGFTHAVVVAKVAIVVDDDKPKAVLVPEGVTLVE